MMINWYSPSIIQGMNKALDKTPVKKTLKDIKLSSLELPKRS